MNIDSISLDDLIDLKNIKNLDDDYKIIAKIDDDKFMGFNLFELNMDENIIILSNVVSDDDMISMICGNCKHYLPGGVCEYSNIIMNIDSSCDEWEF